MSEGKNLGLQRCTSLKDLPSRRKQRANDREHVAEKLQRRPPKFNQFSQNGVFGRDSSLKSIALTAPYLGLVGTCVGILNAFGGVAMEKHAAMVMITTKISLALITTAAGIPPAVLAACSYNYLRTRIDLLEGEVFDEGQQRGRHFRGARRFPPTKRFSELPAFGLIAAPGLAIVITGYMTFASFHTPTGFYVELAWARCEYDGDHRPIVLHNNGRRQTVAQSRAGRLERSGRSLVGDLQHARAPHALPPC